MHARGDFPGETGPDGFVRRPAPVRAHLQATGHPIPGPLAPAWDDRGRTEVELLYASGRTPGAGREARGRRGSPTRVSIVAGAPGARGRVISHR